MWVVGGLFPAYLTALVPDGHNAVEERVCLTDSQSEEELDSEGDFILRP